MKKKLYKSILPKSLSVVILTTHLMSSQILAVFADEVDSVEEFSVVTEEVVEPVAEEMNKVENNSEESIDSTISIEETESTFPLEENIVQESGIVSDFEVSDENSTSMLRNEINSTYYDDPTIYPHRSVTVYSGGFLRHLEFYKGNETINESIQKALTAVNNKYPNLYTFYSVTVEEKYVTDFSSGYQGLSQSIDIIVSPLYDNQTYESDFLTLPFETEYIENSDMLVGEQKIVRNGINGRGITSYSIYYLNNVEIYRTEPETTIWSYPTNQILEIGTKVVKEEIRTEEIPFEVEYIENIDLLEGVEEVSQVGVNGVRTITDEVTFIKGEETNRVELSNEITKTPITEIIQVGVKEIKTEVVNEAIPFETEFVQNDELLVGEENELTAGVDGEEAVTYEVVFIKGKEVSRERISGEVKVEPVTRVVEVGTKEIKEETVTSTLPFEVNYTESADLLVGEEKVTQEGMNGILETTYEVTFINGVEVNRDVLYEEVTTKPVNKIIAQGTREVKKEVHTEVVEFETERVDNPDLLVGVEEVSQVGVNGVRTITDEVTFIKGEETNRVELSNEITKTPITEIIQVGVKEIKTEVVNEAIPFETEFVQNDELLVGEENELSAGVDGEEAVTYEVVFIKGKEVSRERISGEVKVEPVTRVVEVGTKEIKEETVTSTLPFEVNYTESADLLVGEEKVTQEGMNGILETTYEVTFINGVEVNRDVLYEEVTTKPVNKIITQGTREVKKEVHTKVVEFETERVDNPDLLVGVEEVSQVGVNGVRTITDEVTLIKGVETNRVELSNEITKASITEIIQVGVKEIKTEVVTEAIPFETEFVQNDELLVGEENELTAGVDGEEAVTYEVVFIKGKEVSRKRISGEVKVEPVTRVVEVGSKEVKEESVDSVLAFEVEYVESADLLVGEEKITQEGIEGVLTKVFEVTYVNGEEVERVELSSEVTKEAVKQIVAKGIREVKEEVRTEVVPFETERVNNPEMLVGEEEVSQQGVDGERTITENVYTVKGEEVDREVVKDEVTTAAINEIIQVGVKEVKVEEVSEVIDFDTEYVDNAEWLVGVEEVVTPGANGEVLVTYEITYVNGEEVSRTELSRVVLVDPITQVVERGTKEVEKPVESDKDVTVDKDTEKVEAAEKVEGQETLPDTGEEQQYAIFGAAALAILAGLGMIVPRKREE
ncbi:G5 domain-containing protein [Fundicoccus sp. Sow4_H7]|uniref:G5 domain-containing protein n=1 Tax=Fundicoccus sp. Sow4_H7 TaxID=3438784 RepID=UPI003F8E8F01